MYLRIMHNPFATVRLPEAMFDDPRDEHHFAPVAGSALRPRDL